SASGLPDGPLRVRRRRTGRARAGPGAAWRLLAVAVVLALLSALSYGVSDYLAGVTSRAWDSRLVTAAPQLIGLATASLRSCCSRPGTRGRADPVGRGPGSRAEHGREDRIRVGAVQQQGACDPPGTITGDQGLALPSTERANPLREGGGLKRHHLRQLSPAGQSQPG